MPRVPVYQPNQVAPVEATGARFRAADNGGGIGRAISEGFQRVGAAVQNFANVQDEIDLRFDDTMSRKQALDYQVRATEITSSFEMLEGENAPAKRAETEKALKDLRDRLMSSATNPRMRQMLDERLSAYAATNMARVASHSVKQLGVMEDSTDASQAAMSAEEAIASWQDPKLARAHIQTGLAVVERLWQRKGLGADRVTYEKQKYESGIHRGVIDRMLSDDDVDAASVYFDAHLDDMTAGDEIAAANDLKEPLLRRQAANDFATAVGEISPVGSSAPKAGKASPVADGGAIVRQVVPGADITSTYRPKDHPLSRANPRSWHTQSHGAVDVKPVKGMTFQQYVKRFEDQGYTIIEAKEEVGAGRSAHATGDHWHIVLGGQGTGTPQQSPQRWDKDQVYRQIDAKADKEGWSFERRERAKSWADNEISRDEQLKARQEDQASRDALDVILRLGDGFTSINQIPKGVRDLMDPRDLETYRQTAERNSQPKVPPANGMTATLLELQSIYEPEAFKADNLGKYADKVTPAELQGLAVKQAKMRTETPNAVSLRGGISSTISLYATDDMKLTGKDADKPALLRIHRIMETELMEITGGKREPTDQEYRAAFDAATRKEVVQKERTVLGLRTGIVGDRERRRYELRADDITPSVRKRIQDAIKSTGGDPNDEEAIVTVFQQYRGKKGFW